MKKLRLNVAELRVEQFQPETAVATTRGTVRGYTYPAVECGEPSAGTSDPCFCDEAPITYTCE